jgi:hypothetical protein
LTAVAARCKHNVVALNALDTAATSAAAAAAAATVAVSSSGVGGNKNGVHL